MRLPLPGWIGFHRLLASSAPNLVRKFCSRPEPVGPCGRSECRIFCILETDLNWSRLIQVCLVLAPLQQSQFRASRPPRSPWPMPRLCTTLPVCFARCADATRGLGFTGFSSKAVYGLLGGLGGAVVPTHTHTQRVYIYIHTHNNIQL